VFHDGRWQWACPVENAHDRVCPACQRISDEMPAGILTPSSKFYLEHRKEILGLLRHAEGREVKQHPLARIHDPREIAVGHANGVSVRSSVECDPLVGGQGKAHVEGQVVE